MFQKHFRGPVVGSGSVYGAYNMINTLKSHLKLDDLAEAILVSIDEGRRLSGNESRSSFYRALAAGELDAVKRGRRTLVTMDSIRRRLRSLPKATFGLPDSIENASSQNAGAQS